MEDVYEPQEDSYLLQKFVRKYARGKILDLGTGSGIQALTAAKKKKVKSVLAVDVNPEAIRQLKEKIKQEKLKKIKVKDSNLFSQISGKFETIIFNPPYLPQDPGIEDVALYGGKKGWELSEKFFQQASNYLTPNGKILFLFSTLTNKAKIEELIHHPLLEFRELGKLKLSFEELFVYEIKKSKILQELEKKGISKIIYFTHGQRGEIFVGFHKKIKVAIKIKRKESLAQRRIQNEAFWLKKLNKKKIGPKLLFSAKDYLVYEFVEGIFIKEILRQKVKLKKIMAAVLQQCFILDQLKINKEEMHRPWKHIIISKNNQLVLIDFERAYRTEKPHNVTQFGDFLLSWGLVSREKMIKALINYKKEQTSRNFKIIFDLL